MVIIMFTALYYFLHDQYLFAVLGNFNVRWLTVIQSVVVSSKNLKQKYILLHVITML